MNAHDRKEFFYDPLRTNLAGAFFFLGGAYIVWHILGYFLGLNSDHFEGTEAEKLNGPYLALFLGLVFTSVGLWFLSKGFAGRPAVVVDGEGLFYRPHGSIIPWEDVRAVEADMQGENNSIILHRLSGPPVKIDMQLLPGFGRKSPVYAAIMQAWQSYDHPFG
jgi:hypothetical protein